MAGDHNHSLVRLHELEDDLEDVAGLVAEVHDMRARVDNTQLAVVVGERDVDPAQIARPGRVLHHLPVRVARLSEQVLEDVVALDLADAEQLRP
jgi:hypothetical protein